MKGRTYMQGAVTAVAVLLALDVMARLGAGPADALAQADAPKQPADSSKKLVPPFDSGAQRKEMNASLDEIALRLARIEAKMDKGLTVKVTEMPAVIVRETEKAK